LRDRVRIGDRNLQQHLTSRLRVTCNLAGYRWIQGGSEGKTFKSCTRGEIKFAASLVTCVKRYLTPACSELAFIIIVTPLSVGARIKWSGPDVSGRIRPASTNSCLDWGLTSSNRNGCWPLPSYQNAPRLCLLITSRRTFSTRDVTFTDYCP